jgi:acyl-coenzyme A thioesterase PaaI-like protein
MTDSFTHKQPNSEMCFVCGRSNPVGLYMQFFDDGELAVVSDYTVPSHYQGYPGIVHGGVVAAMLDEVVARVSMIGDHHHFMMSVRLEILYRQPVPVETPLRVLGRILRLRGRLGKAEGRILLPDGTVAAESRMSLADVPEQLLASTHPKLLNWKVD